MPESLASGKLWKLYLCWRSCSEVKNLQVIWMWHQTIQTHSSSWFWALLIFGSYSSVWPGIIPLTAITIELQLYDMQGFVRNQCIFSFLLKECNTSVIPPTEMRTHKKEFSCTLPWSQSHSVQVWHKPEHQYQATPYYQISVQNLWSFRIIGKPSFVEKKQAWLLNTGVILRFSLSLTDYILLALCGICEN